MNTSTRERSEGRKIYHFPPHDNCKFCRDRHSDTRVESVLRHLKPGEQTAGWRVSIFLTGTKSGSENSENWAGARGPGNRHGMAKNLPCRRTLKGWCDQGFESWLACQNGTGQMSWTLKKSKFSHRQVLEWFSFKDELFNNQSTSSDSSDDTGKV